MRSPDIPSVMPEIDDRTRRTMEESDSRHAESPSLSFEAYRRRRYDELNAWVGARKAVYLDMKYWMQSNLIGPKRVPNRSLSVLPFASLVAITPAIPAIQYELIAVLTPVGRLSLVLAQSLARRNTFRGPCGCVLKQTRQISSPADSHKQ
jgi:hypothetical protein